MIYIYKDKPYKILLDARGKPPGGDWTHYVVYKSLYNHPSGNSIWTREGEEFYEMFIPLNKLPNWQEEEVARCINNRYYFAITYLTIDGKPFTTSYSEADFNTDFPKPIHDECGIAKTITRTIKNIVDENI